MDKNLTKALEVLAKYGFAVDAELSASNERAEIAILSACKTHLSITPDMPNKVKADVADNLYLAARAYAKYFQSLVDASEQVERECLDLSDEAREQDWQEHYGAGMFADTEEMLDELTIKG